MTDSFTASPKLSLRTFTLLVFLLVGLAILRSAIATRLDSWTQDEGYHTVAGVSYIQRHDFRINPEHPPLVKLWVGAFVSARGFSLSPFREVRDKNDERHYVEENLFASTNNPDVIQHRGRIAMWAFNGILLAVLAFALRRVFGPLLALSVLLILVIDPTVAAHLPLVLTDLPIALLGATSVVLAGRAFQTWAWQDFALLSLAMGFAFATKHSAPALAIVLFVAGIVVALASRSDGTLPPRSQRLVKVTASFFAAVLILWGLYGFRFRESPLAQEVFNRPLAEKISDLNSPAKRLILAKLADSHILPRAYVWGLADTVRAGIDGRVETRLFYGRIYYGKVTRLFFPGILAAKLPLGFLALILVGIYLFLSRRLPQEWKIPGFVLLGATLGFFAVLATGATYGGMRHALPAAVLLYIFAGFALYAAWLTRSRLLKGFAVLALAAAALSAIPVFRPYEYYNEIIGMKNAWRYFNDEGLDAEQRRNELLKYYFEHVKPAGEIPFMIYDLGYAEAKYRGADMVGMNPARDSERLRNPTITGTVFAGRWGLSKKPYWDSEALRNATPVARFGNLFVYHGSFYLPGQVAAQHYFDAVEKLLVQKPDLPEAERLFRLSAQFDPNAFFVYIDIGNLCMARGAREEALAAYRDALAHIPVDHPDRPSIVEQIRLVSSPAQPLNQIPPLRDPSME